MSDTRSPGRPGGTPQKPAVFFRDAQEWRAWLAANHETQTELWMGLNRKHVPDGGLQWADAVREALCFGWIDSRAERIDENARRQRWTPRRAGSTWSEVNIALVAELDAAGLMTPAGTAAYERRTDARSGVYAYEQPPGELSPAQLDLLAADPAAAAFWAASARGYQRVAVAWVLGAKQAATRERRMAQLVQDCAAGVLIKPQRYGDEPRWVQRAREARPEH